MATTDFGAVIAALVGKWEGVEVSPHRFGGVEFRVGRREIGHVHVDGVADLLVSVRLRRDLVAAGRALAHRTLPHSGWISFRIRSEHDVPAAVALFRLNYDRLCAFSPPRAAAHPRCSATAARTTCRRSRISESAAHAPRRPCRPCRVSPPRRGRAGPAPSPWWP